MNFNEKNADFYLNSCYFYKGNVATDNMKIDNTYTFLSNINVDNSIVATHNLIVMGSIKASKINVNGNLICFNDIETKDITVEGKLICFGEISIVNAHFGENSYLDKGNISNLESNSNLYVNETFQLDNNLKVNNGIFMDGIFGDGKIEANNIIVESFCEMQDVNVTNKYIILEEPQERCQQTNNKDVIPEPLNSNSSFKVENLFYGQVEEITQELVIIQSDIGKCIVKAKDSLTDLNTYAKDKNIKFSIKDINAIRTSNVLDATRKDIFINKLFYNEMSNYDIKSTFIKEINIDDIIEIIIFSPNFEDCDIDKLKEIESRISMELNKEIRIKLL